MYSPQSLERGRTSHRKHCSNKTVMSVWSWLRWYIFSVHISLKYLFFKEFSVALERKTFGSFWSFANVVYNSGARHFVPSEYIPLTFWAPFLKRVRRLTKDHWIPLKWLIGIQKQPPAYTQPLGLTRIRGVETSRERTHQGQKVRTPTYKSELRSTLNNIYVYIVGSESRDSPVVPT